MLLPFSFFPAFLPPFAAGNTTSGGGGEGLFPCLPPLLPAMMIFLAVSFLPSPLASPSWPSASVTHKPTDRVCRERKKEAGRYGGMVGKGGRGGGGAGTQNTGGGPKFLPAVKSPFSLDSPPPPLPTMQ